MTDVSELQVALIILVSLLVGAYFVALATWLDTASARKVRKEARRRFLNGAVALTKDRLSDVERADRLDLLYRQLKREFPRTLSDVRGSADFIAEALAQVDGHEQRALVETYGLNIDPTVRSALQSSLDVIRETRPYAALPDRQACLMNDLRDAIARRDERASFAALDQIGRELLEMNSTILEQSIVNKRSLVVSVLGVILTAIFGFVSVMQLVQQFG